MLQMNRQKKTPGTDDTKQNSKRMQKEEKVRFFFPSTISARVLDGGLALESRRPPPSFFFLLLLGRSLLRGGVVFGHLASGMGRAEARASRSRRVRCELRRRLGKRGEPFFLGFGERTAQLFLLRECDEGLFAKT